MLLIIGVVFGNAVKRFGCRAIAMMSGSLLSVSVLATSLAQNIYVIYFTNGILSGELNETEHMFLFFLQASTWLYCIVYFYYSDMYIIMTT